MPYQTVNPTTGEVVHDYAEIADEDLDRALDTAHDCYANDWSLRSVAERAKIVGAAAAYLHEHVEEYASHITLEMGKLKGEALSEARVSADILAYYAQHAETFLATKDVPDAPGSTLSSKPIGVIVAIEPWNFPFYQVARVAGPQLVAGNVVFLKHAENVPRCALDFAELFERAGAPAGAFTNVFASIDQIGRVIDDVRVRGVTLTGSERAGTSVAQRAGKHLKKVVLELGGSDPLIVLEDAPMDETVKSAAFGRMVNMGQSCISPKRFIVVGKQRGRQFLDGITQRLRSLAVGDPADTATKVGPINSERALNTLLAQIDTAVEHGAKVALGGRRMDRPGFYLEPTILTDIDRSNPAFGDELFGPIATVYVTDTEDEALAIANATRFGLGGSVYTADLERGRQFAEKVESGMVFVNTPVWTDPQMPFGGVKSSGFGRELSELGIGEFLNKKLITVAAPGAPPFGPGGGSAG